MRSPTGRAAARRRSGQAAVVMIGLVALTTVAAQVPRPFPQPDRAAPPPSGDQARPAPAPPPSGPRAPTPAMLGAPLFPGAQFMASYDAGRGQRYYIFGVPSSYTEVVTFYRTALKQRGDELFEAPPTHQFDIGRFREEAMAFPPTVTIKDYTWGGSAGYPNPLPGAQPARYPTVIQIVPAPAGAPPGLM